MGTSYESHAKDDATASEIRERVSGYEQTFSRFDPLSELSELNVHRRGRVSPDLQSVLAAAVWARSATDGLVDIGVGGQVVGWGYDRPFDSGQEPSIPPPASAGFGWSIDHGVVTLESGTLLDLGGIAKGWVCDRLVEEGIADMVSAGGDLRSAESDLVVEIVDHAKEPVASVDLGSGALATSSRMHRRWAVGQRDAHHLIDPRTGAPAETPITQATVVADTAMAAEVGAKAVLLQGANGLAWADTKPWIRQAIVVWHDGSVFATRERAAA